MMFSREQLQSAWNELPDRLKGTPFHRARTEGLTLKLETLQPTGSYKIRAAYRLLQKSESPGVALSSSGNFAGAFTWAAAQLHILFASFILGCPMFVVIMEVMGARRTQGVRKAIILSNVFLGILIGVVIGISLVPSFLYPKMGFSCSTSRFLRKL